MLQYQTPAASSWNERKRLIRFRRRTEHLRLSQEIKLVPGFLVAMMLVGLGLRAIFYSSKAPAGHMHSHLPGLRPLLVGMVHGAAGSAALMLLVLSTIRSPIEAFLYILIFGFGSIAGMLVISFLLSLPLHWAGSRMVISFKPIQLTAGLFSCVFGLYLGVHLWTSL